MQTCARYMYPAYSFCKEKSALGLCIYMYVCTLYVSTSQSFCVCTGSEISRCHVANGDLKSYFATKLQRWATVVATSKFARARDRVLRSNAGARGAGQQ